MRDSKQPLTKIVLVVAAALIDVDGRVLVQQRPQGKSMAGLWEFPGGKVEPDEAPEAALVRELAEELGIAVAIDALTPMTFASADISEGLLILLFYRVMRWAGETKALHADALLWLPPAELQRLEMPPADVPLVAALKTLTNLSAL